MLTVGCIVNSYEDRNNSQLSLSRKRKSLQKHKVKVSGVQKRSFRGWSRMGKGEVFLQKALLLPLLSQMKDRRGDSFSLPPAWRHFLIANSVDYFEIGYYVETIGFRR